MTAVALVGDCTTTTALALAASWPLASALDVIVTELDPSGGSVAAWLDAPISPSLTSLVAALHSSNGADHAARWAVVDSMVRRTDANVRFIPAPFRSREARSAVAEAERTVARVFADRPDVAALFDLGRIDFARLPASLRHASAVVVCHRLDASSAPAATVRLERLAELISELQLAGHTAHIALIGNEPFRLDEVLDFAAPGCRGWQLDLDPLAAAVLAGRSGVTARRLARLPLLRSAAVIARELNREIDVSTPTESVAS